MLKNSNEKNKDRLKTLATLEKSYTIPGFSKLIAKYRTCKLLVPKLLFTKALREDPPQWLKDNEYVTIFNDKNNTHNPGKVWNEVIVATEGCERLLSLTMNDKKIKELLSGFDSAMDLFMNKKKEREASQNNTNEQSKPSRAVPETDERSSEDENGDNDFASSSSEGEDADGSALIDEDEILKQYEGMLVASDEEGEDLTMPSLNPDINYNEVTDEEPSESENDSDISLSDGEEDVPPLKKQKRSQEREDDQSKVKTNLPELMTGYYSGGSDDEISEDEVAAKQASNEPKRKNRRGQRARQKIWEKKYGHNAKHVQRQVEAEKSERERKKQEYEARVAKRAARAQDREATTRKRPSDPKTWEAPAKDAPIHPSWEAKKMAEEKQKGAKFQGKKIVF